MNDQLDRSIEIPKKRIPWVKYFFQFAIPAFLVSIKASGQKTQGKLKVNNVKSINKTTKEITEMTGNVDVRICIKPLIGDTLIIPEVSTPAIVPVMPEVVDVVAGMVMVAREVNRTITGIVTNERGDRMPGVSVRIKGAQIGVAADNNGQFRIVAKQGDILLVTGAGLEPAEVTLGNNDTIFISVKAAQILGGQVFVVGGISARRTKKEKKIIPLLTQTFKDTAFKFFKAFPNPVPSGSNLTIEWKQTEEGYYTLQLLNQSGQVVHQQEIWIDKETRIFNIATPPVAAGNYFLIATNKKSGKKYTEKIIIQ